MTMSWLLGQASSEVESFAWVFGVGILILYILLIVKFFQIAGDVRAIRDLIRTDQDIRYSDEDEDEAEDEDERDDIEQLRRLGELHKEGVLTDEGFTRLKEGMFAGP
ncbi:MAG TPA: hypothetical protein VFY54_08305 [Rubrobacter sp.]|nr:hypothetical protein [Rubrobacter sp.]